MTNLEIRKQAKQLCKPHIGTLRLVSFVAALMTAIVSVATGQLSRVADMYILSQIISFVCNIFLYPIIALGTANVYLQTWRGKTPSFSMLWRFVSSKELLLNALRIGLVYQVLFKLFSVPTYLLTTFQENITVLIILLLVLIVLAPFEIWLICRFMLIPYLFSVVSAEKTSLYFKESFWRMKGNIGRLIALEISTIWWRFLVLLVPMLAIASALRFDRAYLSICSNMFLLLVSLLMPYPYLTVAGFANSLIKKGFPPKK